MPVCHECRNSGDHGFRKRASFCPEAVEGLCKHTVDHGVHGTLHRHQHTPDMGSAGNSTLRGTSPPETWIPACAESTPRLEQKGSGGNDRIKDWIPASAESTPRIGKKCSGGNDR